ncbi:MAG: HDIG domain-containing protein [Chloroflexi bacterium]|nr:HDIG domain-containing protein [Chloroflexota bacterium]
MIAGDPSFRRVSPLTPWQTARAFFIAIIFALALGILLAFQPLPDSFRLEAGKVSPKTILAPERVTFASQLQTEDARAKAEAQTKDVYDPPDANLARERVRLTRRVFDYIDSVRHDPYSDPAAKLDAVQAIPNLTLSVLALSRTLALDETVYHRVVSETLYVVDGMMREEIRAADFSAASAKIPARVSLAFTADEADFVAQWARVFITPNSFLNAQRTNEQRALAHDRVGTVYRTIEKGEAVVREGEIVSPLALESLEALGILRTRITVADYAAPFLFALVIVALLAIYLARLRRAVLQYPRALLLIATLIIIFVAGAKWLAADRVLFVYLYPVTAATMLIAVLIDTETALAVAVALALCIGYVVHSSLELTVYALLSGISAALSLGRIDRLTQFFRSGAYIAGINALLIIIFQLAANETNWLTWSQFLLAALAHGALAALVALGSLFGLGRVFGITTSIELLDLARPTHPLLQKLLRDAPGTYHHSLIVGQLAEQAAHAIGADALLVHVGAYYHDVGKTNNPHAFVENQLDGINIHDSLAPQTSAAIVIDHVAAGLALTAQYALPQRVRDLIPQHHGTTHAAYFFRQAAQNGAVNENDFRYPGPKPQSREAAILMLADSVEATTRADRPSTPEQIRALIARIVDARLRDGQLSECDLTLRDLQQIQDAFFGVLQGLFHPRIRYPEAKV